MEQNNAREKKMSQLRNRAMALQKKLDNPNLDELSAPETRRLLEEMNLFQTELEMQNEQLMAVTEELTMASRKFEDLYDFAPVGYVTLNDFGLILEANLACFRLFNLERHSVLNQHFAQFLIPEQLELFFQLMQRVLNSNHKVTGEFTFLRPDHSIFHARLECLALESRLTEGRQIRTAIIDITEAKEAQLELEKSQQFIQKIADTIPDILTVYDLEMNQNIYGNQEMEKLLGLDPEKVKKTNGEVFLKLVHPSDVQVLKQHFLDSRNLENGEVLETEYRIRNKQEKYLWLRVRTTVFQRSLAGEVTQILSVQQDVTFKKEADEELRYKNQIINGLQSNLPIVVSLIQEDGEFIASSGSGMESLKKVGMTELVGHNIYQLFPDLRPQIEAVFRQGEKVSYQYCLGPEQDICFQNFVYLDKTLNAAIAFSIDISVQTEAERRIRAEQELSQSLLDNSVDGILAFDLDLRLTAWNKVMQETAKLSKEVVLGHKLFDLFPHFENSEPGKAINQVLLGKRIVLYQQDFNLKNLKFEAYLNPLYGPDNKVNGVLCILHNVTTQRRLELESTQLKLDQQKAILNAVLSTQEEERKRIAESLHNGVGQLLYAAKLNLENNNAEKKGSMLVLNNLLEEAIRETRTISFELMPSILEDFGLETALKELQKRICQGGLSLSFQTENLNNRFEPNLEIAAYRIIQELVNNILKHAKATDAMVHVIFKRRSLRIIAEDNGIGFEVDVIKRRPKGIGLTSIQNRVKLLDGQMDIQSRSGKGTIVTVTLKV